MLAHKRATLKLIAQHPAVDEGQPQCRHMRAQRIVGRNRAGDQRRVLGMHPDVHVLAVIAVGPPVKAAVLDRGQIIRDQIVAQLVTLVDHGEQRLAAGVKGQPVGIAQSGGIKPLCPADRIDLPDRRAALFSLKPFFDNIRVGPDPDVQLRAIGAGDQILGPVVIDRATGQISQDPARTDRGAAGRVLIFPDRIGRRDVKFGADQRDPERRGKLGDQHGLLVGHPVTVAIVQQQHPVARFPLGVRAADHQSVDDILRPLNLLQTRPATFDHQQITAGQGQDPARPVQIARDRRDGIAGGNRWAVIGRKPDRLGDGHRRE